MRKKIAILTVFNLHLHQRSKNSNVKTRRYMKKIKKNEGKSGATSTNNVLFILLLNTLFGAKLL